MQTLFKYRSLDNTTRFLDIIVNKRLYMAHYDEMNDPMEGAFLYKCDHVIAANKIWSGKKKALICSLSKINNNTLLWSHYADGHKGCCIEVEITSKCEKRDVDYGDMVPCIDSNTDLLTILSKKSSLWKYEEEVRYFKECTYDSEKQKEIKRRPYLKVKIKRIYLGYKMTKKDVTLYTNVIQNILGKDVPIVQMKKEDLNWGFRNL